MAATAEQDSTANPIRWAVVVPVYNEKDYLPRTLESLAAQTEPFELLLVDNGSTDGCIEDAKRLIADKGINARLLSEKQPGQVHALRKGIEAAKGEFIAICDADTYYPPHYLRRGGELFDAGGPQCVAANAWLRPESEDPKAIRRRATHRLTAMRLLPKQNHTGGSAQTFRLDALRKTGGYDPQQWPYVLKDHELMHRMLKMGDQANDEQFWCISSERRASRANVRWTLFERLMYHFTPFALKDWFFYSFLARRFAARQLSDTVLRQRAWEDGAAD